MSSSMLKVHRQFALSYLIQVSLLLILYFLAVPEGPYLPETTGLTYAFSLWYKVGPTLLPVALILYALQSSLILSALASLSDRTVCRRDVFHHVLTTFLFLICFAVTALVFYLALHPVAIHFKKTGVTEIPFVACYVLWVIATALVWKFFAYTRLITRIRYFQLPQPRLGFTVFLSGFRGPGHWSGYMLFLSLLIIIGSVPIGMMISGAILQQPILLAGAIMAATLAYSYGNFYLIARFWDREKNISGTKKKEGKKPLHQKIGSPRN